MKLLPETKGFNRLSEIRQEFRRGITENYEHKAVSCSACRSPGACCLDEHFVNVRITRLEAAAIAKHLNELGPETVREVFDRIEAAIERYSLAVGDSFARTYSCPLYVSGIGCMVHNAAKPLPCIAHACYENKSDLPPDELLESAEARVGELNRKVYGKNDAYEPIPVAVRRRLTKA